MAKLTAILLVLSIVLTALLCDSVESQASNAKSSRKNNNNNSNNNRQSGKNTLRSAYEVDQNEEKDNVCELSISCPSSSNSTKVPVSLPIRGPPGPPGPSGPKGEKGDPGEAGVPGKPGKNATQPVKVAFFAGLLHNWPPSTVDSDVIFDNVVTNVGNGYSNNTGRFTAPFDGVYKFTVVIAAQGRNRAAVRLIQESSMVLTVWSESIPVWGTASNTAILSLRRNQSVWVQAIGKFTNLHGYMYTTFSGHCLFEE